MQNKKFLSISLLLILFLAGCGSRYQVRTLKNIKKKEADFVEKKENVELRVKQLVSKDIANVFNGQKYCSPCVKGLILTVKNDSGANIVLDEKSIGLRLLTANEIRVSRRVVVGRVVAGLAIWNILVIAVPLGALILADLLFGIHGCAGMAVLFYAGAASVVVGLPLIVSSTGYSAVQAHRFNKELEKDIKRKVVFEQLIPAHKKQTMLLFAKEIPDYFNITLFDAEHQKNISFKVLLKNQKSEVCNKKGFYAK